MATWTLARGRVLRRRAKAGVDRTESPSDRSLTSTTCGEGPSRDRTERAREADKAEARTARRWGAGLFVVGFLGLAGLILA